MKNEKAEARVLIVLIVMFIILLPCIGYGEIPQKINYQGYLTNSAGVPVTGTQQMVFSIYDVTSGGSALWTETRMATLSKGVYSVNLGEVTPISLAFDIPYYLGIKVGTDPEMTPRISLTSVGYAFLAQRVEGKLYCWNFSNPILGISGKVQLRFANIGGSSYLVSGMSTVTYPVTMQFPVYGNVELVGGNMYLTLTLAGIRNGVIGIDMQKAQLDPITLNGTFEQIGVYSGAVVGSAVTEISGGTFTHTTCQ